MYTTLLDGHHSHQEMVFIVQADHHFEEAGTILKEIGYTSVTRLSQRERDVEAFMRIHSYPIKFQLFTMERTIIAHSC